MTPIRPVSEDHRPEPADYELEPNELAACPTPWCNHSEPPYTWQGPDDLHAVICAECQVEGPYKHSEAEAIAAWNQRASLATRPAKVDDIEALGEALHGLSARLLLAGALEDDGTHAAYEKVVERFSALTALTQAPREQITATKVAHAARNFCSELQEDGEGVPQPELVALHKALNEWEGLGPRGSMFDDSNPQTSVLADLEMLERDPHATDLQRRIAARALVVFSALTQAPRSCCADERERCAKIAETWPDNVLCGDEPPLFRDGARWASIHSATAIRSNSHDG